MTSLRQTKPTCKCLQCLKHFHNTLYCLSNEHEIQHNPTLFPPAAQHRNINTSTVKQSRHHLAFPTSPPPRSRVSHQRLNQVPGAVSLTSDCTRSPGPCLSPATAPGPRGRVSHQRLHQVVSLVPQVADGVEDGHLALLVQLLQQRVYGHQRARPTHAGATGGQGTGRNVRCLRRQHEDETSHTSIRSFV